MDNSIKKQNNNLMLLEVIKKDRGYDFIFIFGSNIILINLMYH